MNVVALVPALADRQLDARRRSPASGSARRRPGCSPRARAARAPRARPSASCPLRASVCVDPRRSAAARSARTSSFVSGWNITTSSMRLRNSGEKRRSSSRMISPCICSTPTCFAQESQRAGQLPEVLGADVRRHDDDRVAQIDALAAAVGDPSFVERLQEQVQHARARLLDLVEQDDRVRVVLQLIGQHAAALAIRRCRAACRSACPPTRRRPGTRTCRRGSSSSRRRTGTPRPTSPARSCRRRSGRGTAARRRADRSRPSAAPCSAPAAAPPRRSPSAGRPRACRAAARCRGTGR